MILDNISRFNFSNCVKIVFMQSPAVKHETDQTSEYCLWINKHQKTHYRGKNYFFKSRNHKLETWISFHKPSGLNLKKLCHLWHLRRLLWNVREIRLQKKQKQRKCKQAFRPFATTVAYYPGGSLSPTILNNLLPFNQFSTCSSYQTSLKVRIHGQRKTFKNWRAWSLNIIFTVHSKCHNFFV